MPQAVIFDVDGKLIENVDLHAYREAEHLLREYERLPLAASAR